MAKGFLLYEIKKILEGINILGLDISKHALKNAHPKIKKYLHKHDMRKNLNLKK